MAINWRHSESFAETNLKMLENEDLCDVTILAGNELKQIKCHKFILASRSSVFRIMFSETSAESKAVICIQDVAAWRLETLIRYLYSGAADINVETGVSVLYAARKFDVPELESICRTFLNGKIDLKNVCTILDQAIVFDDVELKTKCLEFIRHIPLRVLNSSPFARISKAGLQEVLKLDVLNVNECDLYDACIRWASQRCRDAGKQECDENIRKELGDELVSLIRFPNMTLTEFTNCVANGSVLNNDELVSVYRSMVKNENVSKFMNKPRFDSRFGYTKHMFIKCERILSGWGYWGLQDGISFKLSVDCVLTAVDMFLPIAKGSVSGVVELFDGATVIHTQNVKLCYNKGVTHLLVDLNKPVYLCSVNEYSIRQRMKGRPTFYCGSSKREITMGGVTMTFSDLRIGESDIGTDTSRGQFFGFELFCKA